MSKNQGEDSRTLNGEDDSNKTQDDQPQKDAGNSNAKGKEAPRTAAEWVTLSVSVIVVLTMIGFLLYQQFSGTSRPTAISVEPHLTEVRQEGESYYLPVDITNSGDKAAEDVRVEMSLDTGEEQPETAEVSIMFLNGGARETGVLVFSSDPAAGELSVSSRSFLEP